MRLLVLPPRYGDPFYRRRERGRGGGRRELMGERPPERDSTQEFGEAQLKDLEGKMVEDPIPKAL